MQTAGYRHFSALISLLIIQAGLSGPAGAVVQSPEPVMMEQQEVNMEVREHHPGPGMRPDDHEEGMLRMLHLSREQQAKFQAIHFEHEKGMIRFRAELEVKRLELEQLLSQPDFKESEVRAKAQELQALTAQARQKSLEVFFQIRNILTPEQRSRLPVRWMLHHVFGG